MISCLCYFCLGPISARLLPGQVLCLGRHTPPGRARACPELAVVPLHIAGPCALYIMLTHVPLLPGPCASYFAFQPLCLVHYVWLHLRCRSLCESRLYSVLRTSCRRLSFKDFLAPIQPYAYRAPVVAPRAWGPGRATDRMALLKVLFPVSANVLLRHDFLSPP